MNRKRLLRAGGILAGLLVGVPLLLWGGYAVLALVRQEHFYHGLPSSWWRRQFEWRSGYNEEDGLVYETRGYQRYDRLSGTWVGPVTDYLGISLETGTILFKDPAATPVLFDFIRDGNVDTRLRIAARFADLRVHPEVAIPALVAVVKMDRPPPHHRERLLAIAFLEKYGPQAAPAVPALLECLDRKRPELQSADEGVALGLAVQVLRTIEPEYMDMLMGLLDHPDPEFRAKAPRIVGLYLSPKAKPAVPAIVRLLADPNTMTYCVAARALLRIDPEAAHKAGVPKDYE
jgi:HEAT repeat protein